ncbi:protein ABHD13 [Eurytemora carolleeae]|uniref:protein ABHD13 n=1 Tax=Eurytemora carolleeae TaxID=1294199 RepID=UPI000C775441|nr:protein ABHD13 [Eurytemora carolleeae]XP_023334318.1 protein ABHD13 [Eurytemora carolleeae]XP_023334319.1 protein ABHD13 [Eurytemora carolleeae]|eukprot:XP_023334317.1 protein ABHD13-like [Eurytemora affinis]
MSSSIHPTDTVDTALLIESENGSERGMIGEMKNPDFMFITIIARIFIALIKRFWAFSGAALLSILLFYWLYGGVLAFLLVCFGLSGVLYKAGDRLLYHPEQPPHSRVFIPTPALFNMPFENLFIKARDGTQLHMFLIKQAEGTYHTVPTLLFLHGNAGNIGHRLVNVQGLYQNVGCNIAMLEYRGYGRSDGTPSEEGMYMDAQAGLDYLHTRADLSRDKIIVFGRSLGGAVAVDLASRSQNKERIGAVLLENTFTSIPDIARIIFPFKIIKFIPVWFYKNQFKSGKKICRLTQPTLFISGLADKLIPPKMMTSLYSGCGAPIKRLARFPDGNHNETWSCSQYYQTINYFLDEAVYLHSEPGRKRTDSPTSLVAASNIHNV